jgi:hypothetical protein
VVDMKAYEPPWGHLQRFARGCAAFQSDRRCGEAMDDLLAKRTAVNSVQMWSLLSRSSFEELE